MTAQIDICNRALAAMSHQQLASLADQSQGALYANLLYQPAVNQTLRAQEWTFARKVLTGSLLKSSTGSVPWTNTQPEPPWLYEYMYPDDCIRLNRIMPQPNMLETLARPYLWTVASDLINANPAKVILTDAPQAILVYNVEVANPDLWEDLFQEAVVRNLSELFTMALNANLSLEQLSSGQVDPALAKAAGIQS
jgi:hypothetical protein